MNGRQRADLDDHTSITRHHSFECTQADAVAFFRAVLAPEEAFLHSVLVNSGRFSLTLDYKRYIDWTGCTHTHPRTLGIEDLDKLLASDAHWARKLDLDKNPELFDILDQRIQLAESDAA